MKTEDIMGLTIKYVTGSVTEVKVQNTCTVGQLKVIIQNKEGILFLFSINLKYYLR